MSDARRDFREWGRENLRLWRKEDLYGVDYRGELSPELQKKERELIKERRAGVTADPGDKGKIPPDARAGKGAADEAQGAVGLALSGGGIRSASFNLGVIQAMEQRGFWPRVDYLSTVSGGGYIGSTLTWCLQKTGGRFPFPRDWDEDGARLLRHIRRHASYLTPGDGLDIWALASAVLRGMVVNILVFLPVLFFLVYALAWNPPQSWTYPVLESGWFYVALLVLFLMSIGLEIASPAALRPISAKHPHLYHRFRVSLLVLFFVTAWLMPSANPVSGVMIKAFSIDPETGFTHWRGFETLMVAGIVLLLLLLTYYLLYALFSRSAPVDYAENKRFSALYGRYLKWAVALLVIGSIPLMTDILQVPKLDSLKFGAIASTLGAISIAIGWLSRKTGSEVFGYRALAIKAGLSLFVFGLLVGLYILADWAHSDTETLTVAGLIAPKSAWIVWGALLFAIGLSLFSDINQVSMHGYYRNRLMQAFMPDVPEEDLALFPDPSGRAEDFSLSDIGIGKTGAPYHILNTNITTLHSKNMKYRARGGDNFVFTPLFTGSSATSFLPDGLDSDSPPHPARTLSLATACAISGAAVNPNTGATRSRPLAFIMTLLNVRLGYWLPNPRYALAFRPESPLAWLWFVIKEMSGRLNEDDWYVHLSDGGHFENLGLYELVRRRCPYIVVSDAGADPKFGFRDLARVCELVRTDFGADIEIDSKQFEYDKDTRLARRVWITGQITYRHYPGETSKLIYIKTAMTQDLDLPEDVRAYRQRHEEFPDQSTANQFFDEAQFEAYRELGYRIAETIFANRDTDDLDAIFTAPDPPVQARNGGAAAAGA